MHILDCTHMLRCKLMKIQTTENTRTHKYVHLTNATSVQTCMYISRMQITANTHIPNHVHLMDANYHKHAYTQVCTSHKHTLTSAINLAKTLVALSYCKPSSHIAWTQSVILCLLIGKFRPREVDIDIFITASTVAITGSPSR